MMFTGFIVSVRRPVAPLSSASAVPRLLERCTLKLPARTVFFLIHPHLSTTEPLHLHVSPPQLL